MGERYVWGFLRLAIGWTFVWAFIDKVFGLGFSTCRDAKTHIVSVMCDAAWINGGSPTYGFLKFATKGPLAELYQMMAGWAAVEWLFMLGLLFVGGTLLLGIAVRPGALAGIALYILFYTAGFMPPEHNPFIDEHVINSIIMIGFLLTNPGRTLGLGSWWENTSLVKRFPILR